MATHLDGLHTVMKSLPKYGVKQYVARLRGSFCSFDVFETGDPRFYLFCVLDPTETFQTGLSFPVEKANLYPDVRAALRQGWGF